MSALLIESITGLSIIMDGEVEVGKIQLVSKGPTKGQYQWDSYRSRPEQRKGFSTTKAGALANIGYKELPNRRQGRKNE